MKLVRAFLILSALLLGSMGVSAQALDYVQGELLVKFYPEVQAKDFVANMNHWRNKSISIDEHREVVPEMNIHALTFDHNTYSEYHLITILSKQADVEIVQLNHIIKKRATVPNDPAFASQWQYINSGQLPNGVLNADLDIDLAWDYTTGGLTALGDTIVICVVDDGLNPQHMDFGSNLWKNHAEIPGNSLDDDGNGYIDDDRGWDTYDEDGNPLSSDPADWHGTPVAGIIGAKGDNGIGVAGVNWNVKLMIVRGGGDEANALASYNYPLVMRKKYNETNGQEGAFVVATNSSWGTDGGQPDDAPLWCAMYDTLGVHGILSAGATANSNQNIDAVGDLPTACSSEYLMSVTNVNESDVKEFQAGYGLTTIDLGAYGENTYTVSTPNAYEGFGGTSGATPHVAGTIGLLYSAPCDALASLAQNNPAAAARLVRDAILNGVTPNTSLDGRTVTGGRLNVLGAMEELLTSCGPCPALIDINVIQVSTEELQVSWSSNDSILQVEVQHRPVGSPSWTSNVTSGESYNLTNLDICQPYEIRIRGLCSSENSIYSDTLMAITDGCCDMPVDIETVQISEDNAMISWSSVTASTSYNVRIREQGATSWDENTTSVSSYNFMDLNPCTVYEVQLQTVCADSFSQLANILILSTPGCGSCLDIEYCEAFGGDTEFDFIQRVEFNDFINNSGNNNGYKSFTDLSLPHAERDRAYTIKVVPGYTGVALNEYYNVWIDFDADGIFNSDEKVLDLNSSDTSGVSADILIPSNAALGSTRVRIGMRFSRDPMPCEDSGNMFGEYEDYCLTIDENSGISTTGPDALKFEIYPNPTYDQLIFNVSDYSISKGKLMLFDQNGQIAREQQIDISQNDQKLIDISDLAAGIYILRFYSDNQANVFTERIIKL